MIVKGERRLVEVESTVGWERSGLKVLGQVHALDLSQNVRRIFLLIRSRWLGDWHILAMRSIQQSKSERGEQSDDAAPEEESVWVWTVE